MAFYNQHAHHQSWDQAQQPPPPPSSQSSLGDDRWSGRNSVPILDTTASSSSTGVNPPRDEVTAFASQFEEIDRAHENLVKSGRAFGMHPRRESSQSQGPFARQYPEFDRGITPRHHAMGDYEGSRSHSSHSSSSYQGYIANQRFGPRMGEAEHMVQYKRRAAAQRERELRNYHQEQQFNRSQPGPKPDRSMSPNAMNEEDRRDLIARQHRALYGDNSSLYVNENISPRPVSQDARVLGPGEASAVGYESFSPSQGGPSVEPPGPAFSASSGQGQRSRENSITSKSPGPNAFTMFDSKGQQTNRTSSSSPGASPTLQGSAAPGSGNVAPIGTRPNQSSGKRNTPPMPSPLGPSSSSPANPASSGAEKPSPMTWNNNSGPWGSNKTQTSVWG